MPFVITQEFPDGTVKRLIPSTQLPDDIASVLGRCIAAHSLLEITLSLTLYALVDVNAKIGRIAVGNPRTEQLLDRMQQVMQAKDWQLSTFPWKDFRKELDNLKTRRDLFAHSPWGYDQDSDKYVLFATSGAQAIPNGRSVSRKIYPEGIEVTALQLETLEAEIGKAIERARELDRSVRAGLRALAESSPETPP